MIILTFTTRGVVLVVTVVSVALQCIMHMYPFSTEVCLVYCTKCLIFKVLWRHHSANHSCYNGKEYYVNIARGFGSSLECNKLSITPLCPISVLCPKFCWGWLDEIWPSLDAHLHTHMKVDTLYFTPSLYYGLLGASLFATAVLLLLFLSLAFAPDERDLCILYALVLSIIAAFVSTVPICVMQFTDILSSG